MECTNTATVIVKTHKGETKKGDSLPPEDTIFLTFVSETSHSCEKDNVVEGTVTIKKKKPGEDYNTYEGKIEVQDGFGRIGAVIVKISKDKSSTETFIDTVTIQKSMSDNLITFSCKSWVQPKNDDDDDDEYSQRRIFFSTKSYLPDNTPAGLVKLRAEDLRNLRGEKPDGTIDMKERKENERIYDYDVYNDLGETDDVPMSKRHVFGGSKEYPYPRRCRTGRPHYKKPNDSFETRGSGKFYVPRDEEFSKVKQSYFPDMGQKNNMDELGEDHFTDLREIESLYHGGIKTPSAPHKILHLEISSILSPHQPPVLHSAIPLTTILPPAESHIRDRYNWLSDGEFARQTLAGVNPCSIQLVKSLPFESALDIHKYGPKESKFTPTWFEESMKGSITYIQAITQKKLFVLDYHDILMPYVIDVRNIDNKTLYGSRTLFFLNSDDTLMPLGIELTRPPMDGDGQWKEIFKPSIKGTDLWQWRFAKAHVLSHDSCVHQLVIHWLRAHCCMETYAIATNRQLSTMHPIYRLLHPHFRYNMRINAQARKDLISAGGLIEGTFSTASLSMELSSLVYKNEWRFDQQALPNDLIRRGMAKQKKDEHGKDEKDEEGHDVLELAIKDYPFANDGLILWNAILDWVKDYVEHYYQGDKGNKLVKNDKELQAWWTEIKEKGHPDKKEGWPKLETKEDLIKIVSTIAWVGSGHHSAVNFIQYAYGGFIPNRPSIARINMPSEDSSKKFINQPEEVLLKIFPSAAQGTAVATAMALLSTHSSDEQYIGEDIKIELAWDHDNKIKVAFEKFCRKLKQLEGTIDDNNKDSEKKNRSGAGVIPYDVLKPYSKSGITGMGVPYSVST